MNKDFSKTLKSTETEDWLDFHVIRPFCYLLAKVFARFDVHPNTVTIWSMIIGAVSCVLFAHGCFYYEGVTGLACNLGAIVLLMIGDILDCTDGQLARMTGKKSRLGRILDGLAGYAWFIPIYSALVWRFYHQHDIEFGLLGISDTEQNAMIATIVVFVLALISGLHGLAGQQRIADYYIQVHLFFQKGEKSSELDNSVKQKEIYDQMTSDTPWYERLFQKSYVDYTKEQEKKTPQFQLLMKELMGKYGSIDNVPQELREQIRQDSLKLMPWNGLLTFNFRAFWLFLFCLLDVPAMHFVFETVAMGLLLMYVNHRHEAFCKRARMKIAD